MFEYLMIPCLPPETIKGLGLGVEGNSWQQSDCGEYRGLVEVFHLPFVVKGERINIAHRDEKFRQFSLHQLKQYVPIAARLGAKKVVSHTAPAFWQGEQVASYDCLVETYRGFADYCKEFGLVCCIENMIIYWRPEEFERPAEEIDLRSQNRYFGAFPHEWLKLHEDIGRDNVFLCLDTSHVATVAVSTSDPEKRERLMLAFLQQPGRIAHVHWSDNFLDVRGRKDSHELLGQGSLPPSFHRAVKRLPVTKTFEMPADEAQTRQNLEFVARL